MAYQQIMSGKKFPLTGKILPEGVSDGPLLETLQNGSDFLLLSESMRRLRQVALQVASSDAPVLIHGETGAGKELFARLIHDLGVRASKPFVAVNCGVHEGELFADRFLGHEQGAFTGAHRQSRGCFEMAEDGTLFLDEVGEIPPANQADFLRVLEERRFRRIGGQKDISFAARIVAASNRELPEMVRQGRFRADLFFRLNVIPVSLPSLRERREEVAPLARHFLAFYADKYHRHGLRFAPETERVLALYPWPGNVRELKNMIERLALLTPEEIIGPDRLPPELRDGSPAVGEEDEDLNLDVARREAEIRVIRKAMRAAAGNKGDAARLLGVSPRTLRYKFREYELRY